MTAPSSKASTQASTDTRICCFHVGDILCGLDINQIREITTPTDITHVPLCPDTITGVVNIRGQIVTIIDLKKCLQVGENPKIKKKTQAILVNHDEEIAGLLVDRVDDVLTMEENFMEPPPAHFSDIHGKYFQGVYKKNREIVAVLDLGEILKACQTASEENNSSLAETDD